MAKTEHVTAWTQEELRVLNQILDENPEKEEKGNWKPLIMEFYAKSPDYSARTKKAIREKFRIVKMERKENKSKAEQKEKVVEEVEKGLRLDKEVERLHKDLMKETARVLTNYNKFIDVAILFAGEVYKDASGKEALRINMKELNRVLRALEPELYQMKITELKGEKLQ